MTKEEISIEKIKRSIFLLSLKGQKITIRSVAAISKMSTTTVQRYLKNNENVKGYIKFLELQQLAAINSLDEFISIRSSFGVDASSASLEYLELLKLASTSSS